jgi:hypothetical protein
VPKRINASEFSVFDPSKSKYGLTREEQVRKTVQKRQDAPDYLKNEQIYKEFTHKEYTVANPVEEKEKLKREKLHE